MITKEYPQEQHLEGFNIDIHLLTLPVRQPLGALAVSTERIQFVKCKKIKKMHLLLCSVYKGINRDLLTE